nr:NADH dehydrogenase subunit 4L [Namystynia karyoxenos]
MVGVVVLLVVMLGSGSQDVLRWFVVLENSMLVVIVFLGVLLKVSSGSAVLFFLVWCFVFGFGEFMLFVSGVVRDQVVLI